MVSPFRLKYEKMMSQNYSKIALKKCEIIQS